MKGCDSCDSCDSCNNCNSYSSKPKFWINKPHEGSYKKNRENIYIFI